jgi:hypothetical protein
MFVNCTATADRRYGGPSLRRIATNHLKIHGPPLRWLFVGPFYPGLSRLGNRIYSRLLGVDVKCEIKSEIEVTSQGSCKMSVSLRFRKKLQVYFWSFLKIKYLNSLKT